MNWQKQLFDSLASNHPELNNSGFAHVANVGELRIETPYELTGGLQIRKGHPNEVFTLKNLLVMTRPLTLFDPPRRNPYETTVHTVETKPGTFAYPTKDIPEQEWRYNVIEFQGSNIKLCEFIDATILTRYRLILGPTVSSNALGFGVGYGPAIGRLYEELERTDEPFLSLGPDELDDLRLVYEKVAAFNDDRVNIRSAIKRIEQLDAIPKTSPLRFLGYVSILESLITHDPDPKDPYDSLTRQVRQKMLLLSRRSLIPIPYDIFAEEAKPSKLWSCLYDYRSKIAHGITPDFKKKHRCLKDPITAMKFISCATVAVMRQALEEPDLIADLQSC